MAEKVFRYRAFVSYRHVERDRKWAQWLIEKLESFRTPWALVRRGAPVHIGRLFRDDDEIPASSDLSHQIEQALQESQYLIVVCSLDTPSSRWVCREIEIFRSLGRGNRILALLVDGEPHESFPPQLLHVSETHIDADGLATETLVDAEPIAADLRPRSGERRSKTERRALLRIAAGLLGVGYDDLERRERQRRMRKLRFRAAVAVLLCFFGLATWDFAFVQTDYYRDIQMRFGVPFGVGPIDQETASHRVASYAIDRQFGRTIAVRRVDGGDGLMPLAGDTDGESWDAGAAEWRISYASDFSAEYMFESRVVEVEIYDDFHRRLRVDKYTSLQDGTAAVSSIGQTGGAQAFDAGATLLSRGHSIDQVAEEGAPGVSESGEKPDDVSLSVGKSQIAQHRLIFSEDGLIDLRLFQTVWGSYAHDSQGNYGRGYAYNKEGQITAIRNLDRDGVVRPDYTGVAEVRKTYTEDGEIASVEWRGRNGHLILNADGYAVLRFRRDQYGNPIELMRLGADGKPILAKSDGAAKVVMEYAPEGGYLKERRYFGIDAKPVLAKNSGIWRFVQKYSERMLERRFYGVDNKPILDKNSGVARLVYIFNDAGLIGEYRYFGTDGKPIIDRKYGAARIKVDYDEAGNESHSCNFGTDGKPVIDHFMGAACVTNTYDDRHHVLETRYLDSKGKLFISPVYQVARVNWTYDERGYAVTEEVFDAKGKPISGSWGRAKDTYKYDERGNITEIAHFGPDGNPVLATEDKVARVVMVYDDRGDPIELRYYGVDGEPAGQAQSGAARITFLYDENSMELERAYFGPLGAPTLSKRWGYARATWTYDERGNNASQRFYDVDGKPVTSKDIGAVRVAYRYNERGKMIATDFLDAAGNLVSNRLSGVARVAYRFDQSGNLVEEVNYGRNGERVADTRSGVARSLYTYDRNGYELDQIFFAPDDKPVVHRQLGYAHIAWRYDIRGNKIDERYFGADGKPIFEPGARCVRKTFSYDDRNYVTEAACYSPADKLSGGFPKGAARQITERYQNGDAKTMRLFDAKGREIKVSGN